MSQYGYTIRRVTAPGEPVDLCAPLEFFPPKGTDELHEALKIAFPFEPTLQARMRQAVINFHLSEAQADIAQSEFVQDEYLPSPESSFVSNVTSPTASVSRGPTDPPAQEELMDVWCLPSQPAAKIHTRRNMTAEEKKAYKAKRLAGACADCKRRRRKCDHDPSNPIGASSKKVVKTRKRSAVAKSPAFKACAVPSPSFTVTPAVAVQESFNFAPQDDFFSFDSGFNTSMANDMSFSIGFENSFGNDVGFDLKNDFDLFPDTNPGFSSVGMDAASWLAGSSPDTPLLDNQLGALSRDFNSWPMEPLQAYNTAGVPLTPQSLSPQSLMMSRSQSGHSSSSSSLSSMFGGNNAAGFNQPSFDQDLGNFVLHSPQSLLASPNAGSRSSQRAYAAPAPSIQQFVPTWSPQDMLESSTTSLQSGASRSSSSSSEHWPAASWVGRALLNHNSTDHVSESTTNLERSDKRPVSTANSSNGQSSSSQSSHTTAESSLQLSPASSGQDERARLKSTDPGRTLPPDLGAADGDASRRLSTRMISRATASAPEQAPHVQFVRPSDLVSEDAQIKDTGHDASTANASRRRSTRTTARTTTSEHLTSGVPFVRSPDLTGQAGPVENADRTVSTVRTRMTSSAKSGRTSAGSQATDIKNSDRNASGLVASRRKATASGHSSSANVESALPSYLISQTGYLETSDHHIDLSKLCRLKHSSAAADDVCSALQSSFDLPSLDGLVWGTIVSGANAFQCILLLLFAAMQFLGFASYFFSGLDRNVKTNKFLEAVVDSDISKETKGISASATTRDLGALQEKSQPQHRYFQRALADRSSSWQLFMQQTISRLGGKAEKMHSKSSRIC